jgi:hypothetical protein
VKVTTLAGQVDAFIVPERLIATLSGLFGATGDFRNRDIKKSGTC